MTIVNGTQITVYYIAVSYTALMILCTMLHCTAMRLHDNALRCNTSRYNVQYYSKLALQCHRSMPASQMIIPKATVMHRTIIHHTAMASHRKHQSSAAINGRHQRPPSTARPAAARQRGVWGPSMWTSAETYPYTFVWTCAQPCVQRPAYTSP